MAESRLHRRLKHIAGGWLVSRGYVAVAQEVSIPVGGFRADVAGWTDRRQDAFGGRHRCAPRTTIIECKATRSDFIRDGARAGRLLGRREAIVGQLAGHRVCRPAAGLFRDHQPLLFDPRGTTVDALAREVRGLELELLAIDRRLHGRAKFARMVRWALADALWIATPPGLLRPGDLPRGLGLLECGDDGTVGEVLAATALSCTDRQRGRLLRDIAVAACRSRIAGAMQGALTGLA